MRSAVSTGAIGRVLGLLMLGVLLVLATALATLLAGGAAFLAVWVILLVFGVVGLALLVRLPAAPARFESAGVNMLAIFVFLAVVWPRYASIRLPGLPSLSLTRISLLLLLILGLYLVSKSPVMRARLIDRLSRFRIVFVPLVMLFLLKLVSALFAQVPLLSLRGLLNEAVTVYLPMLIALAVVDSRRDIHRILFAMLAAAVVVILLGLVEYRLGRNLFIGLLEVDSQYLEEVLRDKVRAGGYRLQSTFAHPLTFSEYLVLVTPVAIYLAFAAGFRWWKTAALVVMIAVMAFVIVKTGSRSGIGSFGVVLGAGAVLAALRLSVATRNSVTSALHVLAAISIVVVSAVGLYMIVDILVGRTTREFNSGAARLLMWRDGLDKAVLHPVLGYGQDMAANVLGFVGSHGVLTIDSYFLSVLLDGGFLALLLYLFILGAMAVIALRAGFRRDDPDLLSALLASCVLGFALIKTILSLHHNHALFMVLMAVMLAGISLRPSAKVNRAASAAPVPRTAWAR
ncbi:MAG: O-antigen ligase family protein [Burkholderiaceae bacterium]|nr:O-antigen ligase family protein [Burkholderiaceae bacterium]